MSIVVKMFFVFLVFLTGCNSSETPEVIDAGKDQCEACKMTIVDMRYGGEAVTKKGKVLKFDSIDCLLHYSSSHDEQIAQVYVLDFFKPGNLIKASDAYFGTMTNSTAPMGARYASFASEADAAKLLGNAALPVLRWEAILHANLHDK